MEDELDVCQGKEMPELRDGVSHYLMESLKFQVERQLLRDNLMTYDTQLKQKREEIAKFTTGYTALYTSTGASAQEQVADVINSMLLFLEQRESFSTPELLAQRLQNLAPKLPFST